MPRAALTAGRPPQVYSSPNDKQYAFSIYLVIGANAIVNGSFVQSRGRELVHCCRSTNLAAAGIAPHVTERLLNHATGTISGVAAIYNRFQYLDEMREATRAWEKRLAGMLKRFP